MTESLIENNLLTQHILNCAFYEKCTLSRRKNLCCQFPDFTICPEYQIKRVKLTYQK